jgi:hypothetical protein
MNTFNMECQDCGKTFVTKYRSQGWGAARCDTCLLAKQLDPHAVFSVRILREE